MNSLIETSERKERGNDLATIFLDNPPADLFFSSLTLSTPRRGASQFAKAASRRARRHSLAHSYREARGGR